MSVGAVDPSISTTKAMQEAAKKKDGLNSMDFMKLLIAQLTNQDPLSPMEDMDFTSQIAQLQALEEQTKLTSAMQDLRTDAQIQTGANMIGRKVTGVDTTGEQATGVMINVLQKDDTVLVELEDGRQIAVNKVTRIADGGAGTGDQLAAAANMVNMWVEAGSGDDKIQGIVASVAAVDGKIRLQLYGGRTIDLDDVNFMRVPTDNDSWYALPDEVREKIERAQTMLRQAVTGKNDAGETVTGIMADADRDGSDIYILLYNGERIKLENVSKVDSPGAAEAKTDLIGKWVVGLDENGDVVEGVVKDAEDREDGLALILEDGKHLFYDATGGIFDEKPETEE